MLLFFLLLFFVCHLERWLKRVSSLLDDAAYSRRTLSATDRALLARIEPNNDSNDASSTTTLTPSSTTNVARLSASEARSLLDEGRALVAALPTPSSPVAPPSTSTVSNNTNDNATTNVALLGVTRSLPALALGAMLVTSLATLVRVRCVFV